MTKPLPMDEQKKSVIWREWKRGTPMANIARVIDWTSQLQRRHQPDGRGPPKAEPTKGGRGGSACLNSFEPFLKWISCSATPRPGLVAA